KPAHHDAGGPRSDPPQPAVGRGPRDPGRIDRRGRARLRYRPGSPRDAVSEGLWGGPGVLAVLGPGGLPQTVPPGPLPRWSQGEVTAGPRSATLRGGGGDLGGEAVARATASPPPYRPNSASMPSIPARIALSASARARNFVAAWACWCRPANSCAASSARV